jgi:transcriptional regulator NrdR family protein
MKCPHCGKESRALCSETRTIDDTIYRRRGCGICGRNFVTTEAVSAVQSIPDGKRRNRRLEPVERKFKNVKNDLFERW